MTVRSESHKDRNAVLELAMDNLPFGVGLFHMDGRTIFANSIFKQIYQIDTSKFGPEHGFFDLVRGGYLITGNRIRRHISKMRWQC